MRSFLSNTIVYSSLSLKPEQLSIIYSGLFFESLNIEPIYIENIPKIRLLILPKNSIPTNREVALIFGSPIKKRKIVLIIIMKLARKENNPKSKANLKGASVKGVKDISKKLNKIPRPSGCFVLPFLRGFLS